MARTRTTKKLAQRIDLNYFKRPTPLKRAKFWLSLLLPLLALISIAWCGFFADHRVYSSGRLSRAHSVLEKECSACHVRQAKTFSAKAADSACLACHDGPPHHPSQVPAPNCAACHTEHRGAVHLDATPDKVCVKCHANLRTLVGVSAEGQVFRETNVRHFNDSHPEFLALRGAADPSTIKLNHALHMRPILGSGTLFLRQQVQLECRDCHRPVAQQAIIFSGNASPFVPPSNWTYADPNYLSEKPSYADARYPFVSPGYASYTPAGPWSILAPLTHNLGRELMAPVRFATACSGCHRLTFDKRFGQGVPHDRPEVVHQFVVKKFQEYVSAHPSELRVVPEPDRNLAGKPLPARVRVLSPAQWVAERTADAEELLWRKTCKQCHAMTTSQNSALPQVATANVRTQWMPHSKFDHDAHRGFSCVSCHAKALTSTESSDILLPGIAICKTCHAPGPAHADSRCSECHTYHDWSKRNEVTPKFTLPALRTEGQ